MTATFSMLQAEHNAAEEVDLAERHFAEMQRLMHQVTTDALDRKASLFSADATLERKQAAALRRQALEISRRECLRDTWVAHTGNVQASLFVATVVIGLGYELISGAIISAEWQHNNAGAVFLFFVLCMLSIALGMVSVSLLLARHRRLSQFDFDTPWREYSCGHAHPEMVEYCECRCRALEKWAHYALVASMTTGCAALMIYSVDKFQNNPGGGEAATSYIDLFLNRSMSSSSHILREVMVANASAGNSTVSSSAPPRIRSISAPFIFCIIVGASVFVLVILDLRLLSSDTLQKRPDGYDAAKKEESESAAASQASPSPSPARGAAAGQMDDDRVSVTAIASP